MHDFSNELLVYRYGNGIHLIRPDQIKKQNVLGYPTINTIQSLFNLDLSIYFLSCESRLQNANQVNLEVCGLDSIKQGRGKTAIDITRDKFSISLMENDKTVMRQNQMHFFDESMLNADGIPYNGLTIKIPWYDNQSQIIGVLGLSIVSGTHSLATSLETIQDSGLLDKQKDTFDLLAGSRIDNTYFTKREISILRNIIRGNSAHVVGNILNISQRTVETHIQNIKIKLGVRSKAEIIQKILDNKLDINFQNPLRQS